MENPTLRVPLGHPQLPVILQPNVAQTIKTSADGFIDFASINKEDFLKYLSENYTYRKLLNLYGFLTSAVAKMESENKPINW